MKYLFIAGLLYFTCSSEAQVITPSIINSTGLSGTAGNVSFEFNLGESFTTSLSNGTVITQGLLQPMIIPSGGPLPVLGLEFTAQRINQQVQLNWKTLQEINNKGFFIERRRENESQFVSIRFVPSQAAGGNSQVPLVYSALDTNSFAGDTYYRLKQIDLDGQLSFSLIRTVKADAEKAVTIKAWPIPAKDFYVQVDGLEKEMLKIIDAKGRLVRSLNIQGSQPVFISNLSAGMYYIQLQNHTHVVQKVIVY